MPPNVAPPSLYAARQESGAVMTHEKDDREREAALGDGWTP